MKQDGTVINALKITVTHKNGKLSDEIKIHRQTPEMFVSDGKLNSLSKFKRKKNKADNFQWEKDVSLLEVFTQ